VEPWEDNGPADLWIYQTGAHALLRVAHDAVKEGKGREKVAKNPRPISDSSKRPGPPRTLPL
jgi:hypothetical protein